MKIYTWKKSNLQNNKKTLAPLYFYLHYYLRIRKKFKQELFISRN